MKYYKTIDDLPEGLTNSLPKHAQEIYMEAHNTVVEEHEDEEDVEQSAHRIAWSAVKQKYEKVSQGNWTRKDD